MDTTIAAISTAAAPGGIGIVRISGPQARTIAQQIFKAQSGKSLLEMKGYTAAFGGAYLENGEKLDDVVALVFIAPKSYTGEDVVELSCHGGLYVTKKLLQRVLEAGAQSAEPGEFTKRAFLNGKMDLTQAEAVMQLISATGEQAAKAAEYGSGGALSQRVLKLRDTLTDLGAHLSAWADFPDEDIPQIEENALHSRLQELYEQLSTLESTFDSGKVFREGITTVIAGRPNAGKSTLMNLLSGCERSIVTEYAGTTRDVVEETVLLGKIPLRLADTAGIRETSDPVESIGVSVARERLRTAQLVLAVFDASRPLSCQEEEWIKTLDKHTTVAIVNKTDLPLQVESERIQTAFPHTVFLSAVLGEGLAELEKEVSDLLDTKEFQPAHGILYTERQRRDTIRAKCSVYDALQAMESGLTLDAVTVCVEEALTALYELTGERVSDEIVDQVFSKFCVGK